MGADMTRCSSCRESRRLLTKAIERQAYLDAMKIAVDGLAHMVFGKKEDDDGVRESGERLGKGD